MGNIEDISNELREMFQPFESWRDESQRQFSNIIESHKNKINKRINDLVEEVCDLQAKLSATTKEKNDLIETVNNLSGGIRQLSATLPTVQPLPASNQDQEFQGNDSSEVALSKSLELTEARGESGGLEECVEDAVERQDNYPLEERSYLNDEANHEQTESMEFCSSRQNSLQMDLNSSQEETLAHQKNGYHSDKHMCPECNFEFSTAENFRIHFNNLHSNLEVSEANSEDIRESSQQIDNTKTSEVVALKDRILPTGSNNIKKHIKGVHEKLRKYVCQECKYAFYQKSNLTNHLLSVHNFGDKLKCQECPYETPLKYNLKLHIRRVHEKIKDHFCGECREQCDYTASQKSKLTHHMVSAHKSGDRQFRCDQCPYTSTIQQIVNKHIKVVHDKIREYACTECNYATSKMSYLTRHLFHVHNIGDRQLKCDLCLFETAFKVDLKRHMSAVHNDGKQKLRCEQCDYTASQKSNLKYHMVSAHKIGDQQHTCNICPYTSANPNFLKRHILAVHEKIKRYVCRECGYAASYKNSLKVHMDSVHNKGVEHNCDLCSFKTYFKANLRNHVKKTHLAMGKTK